MTSSMPSRRRKKPTSGDTSRRLQPIFVAWPQFDARGSRSGRASARSSRRPPMIEPISVCDEEAGRPSHQVPRFQMIAAMSIEKTIAKPAEEPT